VSRTYKKVRNKLVVRMIRMLMSGSMTYFLLNGGIAPIQAAEAVQSTPLNLHALTVNCTFDQVPLRDALHTLVDSTHIQIIFDDELIDGIIVSGTFKHTPLAEVLQAILQKGNIEYQVLDGGQLVLYKRAFGQRTIKGYVRDDYSGETLPYANIQLLGTNHGASTNTQGYFILMNAPAGLCTLDVSYIGYESSRIPLPAGREMPLLAIDLRQQALTGDEVAITAATMQNVTASESPSQVHVTPMQVSSMPAVGGADLMRSLQLLPGISSMNDAATGIFIRGGSADQSLVLFDGMPIYHIDHFFGFISAFNLDAVKDVRLLKGAFPARFGGRLSGILELTGKSGNSNAVQVSGTINNLSASSVIQVPIAGRGGWLLSLRRSIPNASDSDLYSEVLNSLATTGIQTTAGGPRVLALQTTNNTVSAVPDFYYYDLTSKVSYMLSSRDLVTASFFRGLDHVDQSQTVRTREPGNPGSAMLTHINDVTEWGNTGFSLQWARRWSDEYFSTLSAATTIYNSTSQRSGKATKIDTVYFNASERNKVTNLDIRFNNELQLSPEHRLEFGAQLAATGIDLNFNSLDTVQVLRENKRAVENSLYLEDYWTIAPGLDLTLGARATYYLPNRVWYAEPRTALRYGIGDNFYLKAALGKYYQYVYRITNDNILEGNRDIWLVSDDGLRPGSSVQRVAGFGVEDETFLFDVEAYQKTLTNVAEFTQLFRRGPGQEVEQLFYLGIGRALGLEVLLQKKTGDFNGWLSYTLANVEYKIDELNRGDWYPASHDRRHEAKAVINYNFKNWIFSVTGKYGTGIPYTEPAFSDGQGAGIHNRYTESQRNSKRLPDYRRVDVSLHHSFKLAGLEWEAGASVYNVLDAQNIWSRQFVPVPGGFEVRDIESLRFTPTFQLQIRFNQKVQD
jgi:ferric enterobactin receptor